MKENPMKCGFSKIPRLNGKSAVILYEGTLYYANQKEQVVQEVKIKKEDEGYTSLIKEFKEDYSLVEDPFLIGKIKYLTDFDHKTADPLSYAEFLEITHELFQLCQPPFTSFSELALQCVDSFNITILLLLNLLLVSFCTLIMIIAIPFLAIYELCFDSVDNAKDSMLGLLDTFVGLGDAIIHAALSIPIQIGSLLARGGLTLLSALESDSDTYGQELKSFV